MATELILKNVRIGFPELFEAAEFKGSRAYSVKGFIEPGSTNDKMIRDAINAEGLARFPKEGKWEAMHEEFRMDKKAYPYIDGKRVEFNHPEGAWVLTARRREADGRPMIIDQRKNPLAKSDGKPYSGCYCNVKVEIWAQDGENKGIRCSLICVQFAKDGDSFGGAKPANDDGMEVLDDTGEDGDDLC